MSSTDFKDSITKYKTESYFKGSIAVASIYGATALLMFLIAVFSEAGKAILTDRLLPFTVTFIGGIIVVVTILLFSIFTAKPPPVTVFEYDSTKCPDYWKLVKTPKGILDMYPVEKRPQLQYMCVRDDVTDISPSGLQSTSGKSMTIPIEQTEFDKLGSVAGDMYAPFGVTYNAPTPAVVGTNGAVTTPAASGSGQIKCGVLYPDYFNIKDKENNSTEQNRLRCAYSDVCGVPWSSTCPSGVNSVTYTSTNVTSV